MIKVKCIDSHVLINAMSHYRVVHNSVQMFEEIPTLGERGFVEEKSCEVDQVPKHIKIGQ